MQAYIAELIFIGVDSDCSPNIARKLVIVSTRGCHVWLKRSSAVELSQLPGLCLDAYEYCEDEFNNNFYGVPFIGEDFQKKTNTKKSWLRMCPPIIL